MAGPTGVLPPTGRTFEVYSTVWQHWQDDRIVTERHHLDVMGTMAQLGLLAG